MALGSVAVRRILGLGLAVLLVAGTRLLLHYVTEFEDRIPVTVVLGEAGVGLNTGSDVKVRGVRVGQVVEVRFEDGQALADLEVDRVPRIPRDLDVVVTAKTLLGPKQVELRPRGRLVEPWLAAGDVIEAGPEHGPTEVQDVLHELESVFDDIPNEELATLIEAFSGFDERDAETVGRNIDQGAELAEFGARTADDQLARLSAFADVVEALATRTDDINRLGRSLPEWVGFLPDRQADVRAALDALSSFSVGLAEFLETDEASIRRLMVLGDRIGEVLDPRMHEIGDFVQGIYRYSRMFGSHGGSLSDGTEHAWFRAHIGDEGEMGRFCEQMPEEFRAALPGCTARETD